MQENPRVVNGAPDAAEWSAAERRQLAEIVLHAAALESHEVGGYLREITGSHPKLLAEAHRRLTAAADLTGSFLGAPAGDLFDPPAPDPAGDAEPEPPPLLPEERYERLELLGEGGMARVFLAQDHQLGRRVALKYLELPDPEKRRRFQNEARAQARVRHENVLEVYETGVMDGTPYIAMRHVEGRTLQEIRETTSLETKVRLLTQVAEGLHAAHREGLLHRDVKPSNILVEETPDGLKPWVADFGIAALEEPEGGETSGGERRDEPLLGTPYYMAPERLRGEAVDRRSDVYSLGVTMYQLFAGELPLAATRVAEGLQKVLDEPPPPLGERVAGLPADLEAIVMQCLAKDPAKRYPSARAVADDLRRYLDGEVVEAHAATLAYRLTRFALRHRLVLIVAAVAGGLLVLALAVAAWSGVEAVKANGEAESRRDQAEVLITFMLGDLRAKLDPLGKLSVLDDIGERALAYFAAIPENRLEDGDLARRSRALYQIGDVRIRQGELEAAVAPLEESLKLARALAGREPENNERLFELGQSHFWLGFAHWRHGNLDAAAERFRAYLEISETLVERAPENLDYRLELSYAHSNLGSVAEERGHLEEALERYRTALDQNAELVALRPDSLAWREELAAAHTSLAVVLRNLGRLEEAEAEIRAALKIREDLVAAEPAHLTFAEFLGTTHDYLGRFRHLRGDLRAAEENYRMSQEIFEKLAAHDPDNTVWRYKLALADSKLGQVLFESGENVAAEDLWRRQGEIMIDLVARSPVNADWRLLLTASRHYLAMSAARRGDLKTARGLAEKALPAFARLVAERPEDRPSRLSLAKSHLLHGLLDEADGNPEAAQDAFLQAIETVEPVAGDATEPEALAVVQAARFHAWRATDSRPLAEKLVELENRSPDFWLHRLETLDARGGKNRNPEKEGDLP